MASIDLLMIEAADATAAEEFYPAVLGPDAPVQVGPSDAATDGFRGFTLSLVVPQPADADGLIARALDAGATSLKPTKKSLWGYGGSFLAPDGTICTVASSSKKDTGPPSGRIDDVVLQLGVADVAASKAFYAERGFTVAKSYGSKYVEFDSGPVALTLNKRSAVAKTAGVPAEGTGSHRLTIVGDAAPFTDPDGFTWTTGSS